MMKRETRTFYTGRMADGSDRQEHVEHVWTERYAGRDYEIKRVTDPKADDPLVSPTPQEIADVLAQNDVAAAVDRDRIIAAVGP